MGSADGVRRFPTPFAGRGRANFPLPAAITGKTFIKRVHKPKRPTPGRGVRTTRLYPRSRRAGHPRSGPPRGGRDSGEATAATGLSTANGVHPTAGLPGCDTFRLVRSGGAVTARRVLLAAWRSPSPTSPTNGRPLGAGTHPRNPQRPRGTRGRPAGERRAPRHRPAARRAATRPARRPEGIKKSAPGRAASAIGHSPLKPDKTGIRDLRHGTDEPGSRPRPRPATATGAGRTGRAPRISPGRCPRPATTGPSPAATQGQAGSGSCTRSPPGHVSGGA